MSTANLLAALLGSNINSSLTPGFNGQPNPMAGGMPQTTDTPTLSGNTALLAQALGIDPNLLNQVSTTPQIAPSGGSSGIGGFLKKVLPLIATAGAGALAGGKNNRMLGATSALGGFQQNEQLKQQQALQERQVREQEANSALGRLLQMKQLEQQQQNAAAQAEEKRRVTKEAALKNLQMLSEKTDFEKPDSVMAYQVAARQMAKRLGITDEEEMQNFLDEADTYTYLQKEKEKNVDPLSPEGIQARLYYEKLLKEMNPPKEDMSEAALIARANNGDEKAKGILDAMRKRELDIASAKAAINKKYTETGDLKPNELNRVMALAAQFDSNPLVKNYTEAFNKAQTVKNLVDSPLGGPADLSIVYEYMKGLDPTSVVRESEYATASKSGNIFAGAFAKFNGYLKPNGGFLPENVRKAFAQILDMKVQSYQDQVEGVYEDFGRRIDKVTRKGDGTEYLTNYPQVYGANTKTAPAKQNLSAGQVIERDGKKYMFKGGDANKKENWKEIGTTGE